MIGGENMNTTFMQDDSFYEKRQEMMYLTIRNFSIPVVTVDAVMLDSKIEDDEVVALRLSHGDLIDCLTAGEIRTGEWV